MGTESPQLPVLSFVVEGQPIAQPRQRQRILWPSYDQLGDLLVMCETGEQLARALKQDLRVVNYTPANHSVGAWKQAIGYAGRVAVACHPCWSLEGAMACLIRVYSPRPKTKQWKRKAMTEYWDERSSGTGGGDFDNHAKAVADALSGITYKDDKQICFGGPTEKRICSGDEKPRAVIVLSRLATNERGCVVDAVGLYQEMERAAQLPAAVRISNSF